MTDTNPRTEAQQLLDSATPGPWEWTGGGFAQPAIVYAPGYEVVEGEGAARVAMCEFLDSPQRQADADLIAAAPRLIAALLAELDARTDPNLAARLDDLASTYDGSMYRVNAAADLRAAARLLGGAT